MFGLCTTYLCSVPDDLIFATGPGTNEYELQTYERGATAVAAGHSNVVIMRARCSKKRFHNIWWCSGAAFLPSPTPMQCIIISTGHVLSLRMS
jgi:hypothetical protein